MNPHRARLRAVLWVPHRDRDRWERACHRDCQQHNERVVAVIQDDGTGKRWADAYAMLDRGEADVIVAGRWDHVPQQALAPIVRIAARGADSGGVRRRQRPRIIE
jgi:hypothetical protein